MSDDMPTKISFAALLSLAATAPLAAQAPATLPAAQAGVLDINNTISLLEQNALLVLIGAIVLMGMTWVCYVFKACTQVNKHRASAHRSFLTLLVLVAGLSAFCSSCSVEQQAMAARYQAAHATENRTCPSPHHYENYTNTPVNNRSPYQGYSNLMGPTFCKYCGQRISNGRH